MSKKRTIIGIIRSRMDSYETRRREGFKLQAFIDELATEGYCVSYSSFRVLYSRAKRQLAQKQLPQTLIQEEIRNEAITHIENPKTKGFKYSPPSLINKDSLI